MPLRRDDSRVKVKQMRSFSLMVALMVCAATSTADSFGPQLPLTPNNSGEDLPAISVSATGLTAIWNAGATVASRVPWQQAMSESSILTVGVAHRDGAAASIGDESLVTWVENDWIYALPIGSDGHAIGERKLIQVVDARHTSRLAVGASRSEYLVVWQQLSSVLATTLDPHGNTITWQAWLAPGTWRRDVEKIAVASDGTDFLVVWEASTDEPWINPCGIGCASSDREIRSVVVGADGNPQPGTEIQLATNAGMPDVVWTGTDYLVLWTSLPNGGLGGRHVSATGTPSAVQSFTTTSDWAPAVAQDAGGVDVAYARLRPDMQTELRAMRINPDGSRSDLSSEPLALGVSARQFALASRGSRVALAYTGFGRINVRYLEVSVAPTRMRAIRH